MTSSESESEVDDDEEEEEEEEMIDELDDDRRRHASSITSRAQRSLRRSSRLVVKGGADGVHKKSDTDRNNNLNGSKHRSVSKKRLHAPEHFFSFMDTTFWQK